MNYSYLQTDDKTVRWSAHSLPECPWKAQSLFEESWLLRSADQPDVFVRSNLRPFGRHLDLVTWRVSTEQNLWRAASAVWLYIHSAAGLRARDESVPKWRARRSSATQSAVAHLIHLCIQLCSTVHAYDNFKTDVFYDDADK